MLMVKFYMKKPGNKSIKGYIGFVAPTKKSKENEAFTEEQIKITFSLLSCTELSFCLWCNPDSIL